MYWIGEVGGWLFSQEERRENLLSHKDGWPQMSWQYYQPLIPLANGYGGIGPMQIKALVKGGERKMKVAGSFQLNTLASLAQGHISEHHLAILAHGFKYLNETFGRLQSVMK